jgi:Ca2+-binding RTX toxin-like protein
MARRGVRRVAVAVGAVALGTFGWPLPVSAGGISAEIADRELTVTGTDQDDTITVRCQGGDVTVNQAPPSGGPDACRGLRRIVVLTGAGADAVRLADVTRNAFDDLRRVLVRGEEGADLLVGSEFGDELRGGGGVDEVRGGLGPDVLSPGRGAGELFGAKGRDTVVAKGDARWVIEDDRLTRFAAGEEVNALRSIEEAVVEGGASDNRISSVAFSGPVRLRGGPGGDRIVSGPGRDLLRGGKGKDQLIAGAGDDVLEGGAGDDELRGGDDNDQLKGGNGDDTCVGGAGGDSFLSCE